MRTTSRISKWRMSLGRAPSISQRGTWAIYSRQERQERQERHQKRNSVFLAILALAAVRIINSIMAFESPRQELLLDADWLFHLGEIDSPVPRDKHIAAYMANKAG